MDLCEFKASLIYRGFQNSQGYTKKSCLENSKEKTKQNKILRAVEMAEQVKVLGDKPDDLSGVLGMHMTQRADSHTASSDHTCSLNRTQMYTHTHTHTHKHRINKENLKKLKEIIINFMTNFILKLLKGQKLTGLKKRNQGKKPHWMCRYTGLVFPLKSSMYPSLYYPHCRI